VLYYLVITVDLYLVEMIVGFADVWCE